MYDFSCILHFYIFLIWIECNYFRWSHTAFKGSFSFKNNLRQGIGEMWGPHAEAGRVIFSFVSIHHYVTTTTTLLALIFRTVDIYIKKKLRLKGWAPGSYRRLVLPKISRELTSLGRQITFLAVCTGKTNTHASIIRNFKNRTYFMVTLTNALRAYVHILEATPLVSCQRYSGAALKRLDIGFPHGNHVKQL